MTINGTVKIHELSLWPKDSSGDWLWQLMRKANIQEAHRSDKPPYEVGLEVAAEIIKQMFKAEDICAPDLLVLESSLFPEKTRFQGGLLDFLLVAPGHDLSAEELGDLRHGYEAVYKTVHDFEETVYYMPQFFLQPDKIEMRLSSYTPGVPSPENGESADRELRQRQEALTPEIEARIAKLKGEAIEPFQKHEGLYWLRIPIDGTARVEARKEAGAGVNIDRQLKLLHLLFHDFAFSGAYQTSYLLAIPVVGAATGGAGACLNGMGALFAFLAYHKSPDAAVQKHLESNFGRILGTNLSYVLKDYFISFLYSSATSMLNTAIFQSNQLVIAGIMARNMSHNIGSHVLASPSLLGDLDIKKESLASVVKLHTYLMQRMDFIAQSVTYAPSWSEPLFFIKDLMAGFAAQRLLLSHLIRDQGYRNIEFNIHRDGELPLRFTADQDVSEQGNKFRDFLISIPGGSTGAHAFYDLIENMMRNSAKYGERGTSEAYELHLKIQDYDTAADTPEGTGRYLVCIWDNLSIDAEGCGEKGRAAKLRKSLAEELLDEATGESKVESRGVQEMVACARMLTFPFKDWGLPEKNPDGTTGTKLSPLTAEIRTLDGVDHLSFEFFLQKPRLLALVGFPPPLDGAATGAASRAGVFYETGLESLLGRPSQIALVRLSRDPKRKADELSLITRHHHALPYRLLIASGAPLATVAPGAEAPSLPVRRIRECSLEEAAFAIGEGLTDWEGVVLRTYEVWLSKYKPIPGRKWRLVISFDRPDDHPALASWRSRIAGIHSELFDVFVVTCNGVQLQHVAATSAAEGTLEAAAGKLIDLMLEEPQTFLLYDNHSRVKASLLKYLKPQSDRRKAFETLTFRFQQQTGDSNHKIFHLLQAPPEEGFPFQFLVLGLIEAAITDVFTLDERIAEACLERNNAETEDRLTTLKRAGCFPVFSAHLWIPADATSPAPSTLPASQSAGRRERVFLSQSVKSSGESTLDHEEGLWMGGGRGSRLSSDCREKTSRALPPNSCWYIKE